MIASEMIYNLTWLIDKVSSNAAPGYTDDELLIALNKAQEQFILNTYDSPLKDKFGSFDSNEKNKVFLANLISTYSTTITYNDPIINKTNGFFVKKPGDHLFTILDRIQVTVNNKSVSVWTKVVSFDEYTLNKYNPYKRPDYTQVFWRFDYGKTTLGVNNSVNKYDSLTKIITPISSGNSELTDNFYEIIVDTNSITSKARSIDIYYINYIRQPKEISPTQDCELKDIVHWKIIELAARILTGITNPELYQIRNQEELINK